MATLVRKELEDRLYEIQNGRCFICQEPLDDIQERHVDHIVPKARGGKDDENNYALVHKHCNLSKLDADLRVARCMAQYDKIKKRAENEGPNRPYLGDFLAEFGGGKHALRLRVDETQVQFELDGGLISAPLYQDPLSRFRFFFAELPVEYLHHDSRINPRAVGDRVRSLIAEFLSGRPQLHPALAWVSTEEHEPQVRVFDGQHKMVAQMLLGVRRLPVRIFVNPDLDILLETNTRAGTVLRQVAFDRSVQRFLGSQIFWEKIRWYQQVKKLAEDNLNFSEADLVRYFRGEHREMKRYILDDLRSAVIHHPENKLRNYLEFGGKATKKPLSYNTIEKTFFTLFIHKEPMNTPLDFKLEIGENPRQVEKEQLIQLMNIFSEEILEGKYDFDRGTYRIEEQLRKGEEIPEMHLRAVRLCREEIVYNILRYVRDCIKRYFLFTGLVVEEGDLFQRRFPEVLWENLRRVIAGIAALPIWINKDPNISSAVFGGKQTYDYWKQVFETGETPGGIRVLAKPLNLDDLIQP